MFVITKMNQLQEENTLHILSNIPLTTRYDRLFIREDGIFSVDTYHMYIGWMGRTIMDTVIGGYNRKTIFQAIESLIINLTHIANSCVMKLDTPYVRGNMRTFGLETEETRRYSGYLQQLGDKMCNLDMLITTLKLVYITDPTACKLLDDVHQDIQTISRVIKHTV
jgi:hypothetical protein